jgi:hypothetical protein
MGVRPRAQAAKERARRVDEPNVCAVPIGVRMLPKALSERIDAMADRYRIGRSLAMRTLLERSLDALDSQEAHKCPCEHCSHCPFVG